jgi:hypothetical protein
VLSSPASFLIHFLNTAAQSMDNRGNQMNDTAELFFVEE